VAALDPERKLVPGVPVVVEVLRRVTYTTRQRVVGGFYAYQDVEEVRRVKTLCRGRTGADGVLRCRRRAPVEGDLIVQARLADASGRRATAHAEVWVPGRDDAWFEMSDSDRIDLVPDRRRYEVGETASVQVRMPFRRARALVTVGREGVLDARVVELTGKDPAIAVPIADAYSPNVFVQVLAVRGRVSGPPPTALVDLGKPSFRVGIAELEVGWKPHALGRPRRARARGLQGARDRTRRHRRRAGRRRSRCPRRRASRSPRSTRGCSSCCRIRPSICCAR
jgi:hypothetical protein